MSNSASSFTGVSSGCTAGTPVPADSPVRDNIADAVRRVRETTPLAQSFTNFVTINLVANAQLAAGGTAAMSFLPDDVIETAKIAGANYINVGTLLPFYKDALPEIAQRLNYLDTATAQRVEASWEECLACCSVRYCASVTAAPVADSTSSMDSTPAGRCSEASPTVSVSSPHMFASAITSEAFARIIVGGAALKA